MYSVDSTGGRRLESTQAPKRFRVSVSLPVIVEVEVSDEERWTYEGETLYGAARRAAIRKVHDEKPEAWDAVSVPLQDLVNFSEDYAEVEEELS